MNTTDKISTSPPPGRMQSNTGKEVSRAGSEASPAVASAPSVDAVHLSSDAASLHSLSANAAGSASVDHARVHAVREAIAAGAYKIDAQKIAERMTQLDKDLSE